MTNEKPVYDKQKGWSCPSGYGWPKCYECGHTSYVGPPQPLVNGKPRNDGPCYWCEQER